MKNLSNKGLSMSDAQSLSNLCFQKAEQITKKLDTIGLYNKYIDHEGKKVMIYSSSKIPDDILDLLLKKGQLHALQGFLRECIKEKDDLIKSIRDQMFVSAIPDEDIPKYPEYQTYYNKSLVDENWGWDQLSSDEYAEYIEAEAIASHYGQFIHKKSLLDELRKRVHTVPQVEWLEIKKDEKSLVYIEKHHTPEELDELHEKISVLHRDAEKKVNYYKAKVKNLVSEENARISKENSTKTAEIDAVNKMLNDEYNKLNSSYQARLYSERQDFYALKESELNKASQLKIVVNPRFQDLINELLGTSK